MYIGIALRYALVGQYAFKFHPKYSVALFSFISLVNIGKYFCFIVGYVPKEIVVE